MYKTVEKIVVHIMTIFIIFVKKIVGNLCSVRGPLLYMFKYGGIHF